MLNVVQVTRYRERVAALDDDILAEEIERYSSLAARVTGYSEYDERLEILAQVNGPLYDAVRARLES